MTEEQEIFWKKGFEAGSKQELKRNDKAIRIGRAILDVMYDEFETVKEDY